MPGTTPWEPPNGSARQRTRKLQNFVDLRHARDFSKWLPVGSPCSPCYTVSGSFDPAPQRRIGMELLWSFSNLYRPKGGLSPAHLSALAKVLKRK